ncbi:ATP-binding protein [Undibacterium sp. Tian12W]|uniref:ATP-binding protein n=1 Tax=Undibacterium sp. Tian12W TaxID=3413054 RepID=UPI003BF43E0F
MDNIAGTPVEGDNFFGRDAEVTHLVDTLQNDDVLLLGARRIGKTSLCRAVIASLRSQDWRAIEINVAACIDERGFLEKLDSALRPELDSLGAKIASTLGSAFSAVTGRIRSVKVPIPGAGTLGVDLGAEEIDDWTKVGSELLALIGKIDQRWLIYVDELPIMLFNIIRNDPENGVKRVRRFLDWFRNDVRALPGSNVVHWLISGSVGLDTLVQQHGMADTINSLSHQNLAAYTDEVAIAMLLKLSAKYEMQLDDEIAEVIVKAVQWAQPYYLQKAFHHLRQRRRENAEADLADLIEESVNDMVQPGADNDFHHWEQRLKQQLDDTQAAHALALLSKAATDPAGVRPEILLEVLALRLPNDVSERHTEIFINLRDILQRDAYWWPDESSGNRRYRFRLEPLRRWWVRRGTL